MMKLRAEQKMSDELKRRYLNRDEVFRRSFRSRWGITSKSLIFVVGGDLDVDDDDMKDPRKKGNESEEERTALVHDPIHHIARTKHTHIYSIVYCGEREKRRG